MTSQNEHYSIPDVFVGTNKTFIDQPRVLLLVTTAETTAIGSLSTYSDMSGYCYGAIPAGDIRDVRMCM